MAAEFNPLYSAVEAGQLEDVRALLAAGAAQYLNLGHADAPYGGTLLHLAARNNDGEIAQQLLHHGAAVGAKDCRGRTPLHVAASWGSTAVMAQLLRAGADPQACDAKGNTPLLLAFSNGMAAAAGLLLDSGAPMDQLYGGDKLFLRNGTPLTINNDQYTLLHAACKWGNLDMLRALLDAGTCVDQPCAYGSTPLWVACQHNREQLLEELLSRGADATIPDNDRWTPLHIACKHKCVKVVKRLLLLPEVLAAVDAANSEGATALYLAAEAGYGEVVSLLVTAGANPHPRVTRDLHPLYAAISHGQSAVASQLLEAGARINGRARDGRTFLHAAIERKQLAVVRQLLALGADPGVAAADGTNSLHAATSANHACILEVLLAAVAAGRSCAGVDAEVRGMTALHLAFEKKHWDCIKVLLAAGADPGKLYGPGAGEWEGASLLHRAVQVGKKGAAAAVPLLATPTTLRHIWEGQTPLHLALTLNKVSVARALVEAGAPPGLHNKAGSTALALAAQRSTRVQIRRLLPAMVRSDCKLYQQEQSQQQQAQQLGQQQQQHGQQQGQAQAPRQQQGQAQQQDNQARDMTAVLADARLALNDVLRHGDMAVGIDCIAAVLEVLGGAAARSLVREVMLQHNTWLWADLLVDLNEHYQDGTQQLDGGAAAAVGAEGAGQQAAAAGTAAATTAGWSGA